MTRREPTNRRYTYDSSVSNNKSHSRKKTNRKVNSQRAYRQYEDYKDDRQEYRQERRKTKRKSIPNFQNEVYEPRKQTSRRKPYNKERRHQTDYRNPRNGMDGIRGTRSATIYEEERVLPRQKTSTQLLVSFLFNIVFYILTIGVLSSAIMFSFSSKTDASIFGYRFYQVLTNSMVPQDSGPKNGFYAGDMIVVKLIDGKTAKEGDIVTYSLGSEGKSYLTHRVVDTLDELNGEKGEFFITKGDSNNTNDPPISAE